jgi:cell volume regulation protein A
VDDGQLMLIGGGLLALGIGATVAAGRLRVPGLVLFLVLGMVLGSDVLGILRFGHEPADFELTQTIGIVAIALILFEGGLAAGWKEIRPVLGAGLALATVGTLVTAAIVAAAAHLILGFSALEGLLLGSIVASTDSAAIFSVLRGSSIKRRLAATLEAESGFNDPVAVLLVIGFIEWIQTPGYGVGEMAQLLAVELAIGAAVGLIAGRLAVMAFERVPLSTPGLYPVASMAAAGLGFGLADALHGSGFLAVYLTGLALGGANIPARRTITDFHAGVGWVCQIALFFTLGLLVFPSELPAVAGQGLLLAAVMAFVARPIAALVSTLPIGFSVRESVLVGWAGLRGALPVVFATFAVTGGVPQADQFFNLVFFVVLVSTLVQGVTFERLAKALGLIGSGPAVPRLPIVEVGTIRRLGAELVEYRVEPGDAIAGRVVNELGLPRDSLVSVIVRGEEALLPRGSSRIESGDRLHIFVRTTARPAVEGMFERWRDGPVGEPEPESLPLQGRAAIFSVRQFDPGPDTVASLSALGEAEVLRTLRARGPDLLVQLTDGRFAVTGNGIVACGGSRQLLRYCRLRISRSEDIEDRAWWQEVAGVVSQRAAR